ncbi:MAG: hypothetical protein QX196_06345 [Methylococcaceae bacterium]|jgi:K(+)-stimulated pyrophosphate-energized sodium pump
MKDLTPYFLTPYFRELSMIELLPNIKAEIKKEFGFEPNFEKAKHLLEENDGTSNTFKAAAKPVLIGTAVVGATTLIFSIILLIAKGEGSSGQLSIEQINALLLTAG